MVKNDSTVKLIENGVDGALLNIPVFQSITDVLGDGLKTVAPL